MDSDVAYATGRLLAHSRGDRKAAEELLPLVYEKLRALAGRMMHDERPDHTLGPTDLVHEAYLRLVDVDRIDLQGRSHFYALAARQMRRVLIDHARRHGAKKRGAGHRRITLAEGIARERERTIDVVILHEALEKLASHNERRSRVAEMRLFAGLHSSEIASVLGVSERTVKNDWHMARAWLSRELTGSVGRGAGR